MKNAIIQRVIGLSVIALFSVGSISVANACGSSSSGEGQKSAFMSNGQEIEYTFAKVKCPNKKNSNSDKSSKEDSSTKAQNKTPSLNKSVHT